MRVLTCIATTTVRVPSENRRQSAHYTRTFKSTRGGLAELRESLSGFAVTRVGMEATGVSDRAPRDPGRAAAGAHRQLDAAILNLDAKIEAMLAPHAKIVELLSTIPGVAPRTAQMLIAECGLDMSRFPTVGHFASWAGICPGDRESAGRRQSGRTRPGPKWLTEALTESAKAAARTKGTDLATHHAQLRGRRGEAKAIGATRHDILVAYYHIVRDEVPFRELGPDRQKKRYSPEHRARRLQKQLEALGYAVTLEQVEQPQPQPSPGSAGVDRRRNRAWPRRRPRLGGTHRSGRGWGIHRSGQHQPDRWPARF